MSVDTVLVSYDKGFDSTLLLTPYHRPNMISEYLLVVAEGPNEDINKIHMSVQDL